MNTHGSRLDIFCRREPFWRKVCFWVRHMEWTPESKTVSYAKPFYLEKVTPENEGIEMPHTFEMNDEGCQNLMDELWRVGFRPTEGSGSAGSLAATERHLSDMRALVFKMSPHETQSR